jgi:cytochrome c-type biogenesis protein CcmH
MADTRFAGSGWRALVLSALLACAVGAVLANEAAPASADPVLEARVMKLSSELRCLVCQNQTIADSHADLAVDLRRQVREMLQAGQSEQQVIDFMTARYGDFVLYRPPFKPLTALLWVGPVLMVVVGLGTLFVVLRRRSRLTDAAFEVDGADENAHDRRFAPPCFPL